VSDRRSAAVGEVAVLDGMSALLLLRALGDWRRAVPPGSSLEVVAAVEEAADALRDAGAAWLAGQAARLPAGGSGEGHGKSRASESAAWFSTRETAEVLGVTPRRVRQLRDEGLLSASMESGRLVFEVRQVLALRGTGERKSDAA